MATRAAPPIEPSAPAPDKSLRRRVGARWQALRAHGPTRRPFSWLVALVLLGTLGWLVRATLLAQAGGFSQEDIDAAVSRTLETVTLPSQAARAYEVIRPSVVRVQAFREEEAAGAAKQSKAASRDAGKAADKDSGKGNDKNAEKNGDKSAGKTDEKPARKPGNESVGTGVVIVDKGVILTNLHVVAGASKITVVFADGLEAEATVIGVRPENDLAVLQARTVPDDLVAAAMRSSADLAVGDMVVAVGFPFGIGPSASSGVVSGLKREYQSPEGKQTIGNLIQFDAAANPGNSGGPLVTAEGEVVGIVTGILSPGSQRVFIGIGFAVPIESAASAAGVPPF
jgi:serine protease DegQ